MGHFFTSSVFEVSRRCCKLAGRFAKSRRFAAGSAVSQGPQEGPFLPALGTDQASELVMPPHSVGDDDPESDHPPANQDDEEEIDEGGDVLAPLSAADTVLAEEEPPAAERGMGERKKSLGQMAKDGFAFMADQVSYRMKKVMGQKAREEEEAEERRRMRSRQRMGGSRSRWTLSMWHSERTKKMQGAAITMVLGKNQLEGVFASSAINAVEATLPAWALAQGCLCVAGILLNVVAFEIAWHANGGGWDWDYCEREFRVADWPELKGTYSKLLMPPTKYGDAKCVGLAGSLLTIGFMLL